MGQEFRLGRALAFDPQSFGGFGKMKGAFIPHGCRYQPVDSLPRVTGCYGHTADLIPGFDKSKRWPRVVTVSARLRDPLLCQFSCRAVGSSNFVPQPSKDLFLAVGGKTFLYPLKGCSLGWNGGTRTCWFVKLLRSVPSRANHFGQCLLRSSRSTS